MVWASTFGRISPKSSRRNVTRTVLNRNSNRRKVNSESIIPAVRITMQIFTRLLTTRIVASSRSTFANKRSTASARPLRLSCKRRTSLCESEKNDVSAPETSAETHNRRNVTAQSTMICGVKPWNAIQE